VPESQQSHLKTTKPQDPGMSNHQQSSPSTIIINNHQQSSPSTIIIINNHHHQQSSSKPQMATLLFLSPHDILKKEIFKNS
jgi:hypothetical protein